MTHSFYKCRSCHQEFRPPIGGYYFVGEAPIAEPLAPSELLAILTRPAWCKDCNHICLVEDILPVRTFEAAYGAARKGQAVQYPIDTSWCEAPEMAAKVKPYLLWRMSRKLSARALCCGGRNYQFLDVAQPLLMHEGCEHGYIEPLFQIGSYCGPGPGVRSAADIPVHDTEGELRAYLKWYKQEDDTWTIEPASYPPATLDD